MVITFDIIYLEFMHDSFYQLDVLQSQNKSIINYIHTEFTFFNELFNRTLPSSGIANQLI